jgi:hypothetical protein
MSLYKQFKTDENVEQTGVWLEYGPNEKGLPIRIRVARAGGSNTRFTRLVEQKTKPYRRQLQNETLDPKVGDDLFAAIYAESVVLGWENVETEDGKPLPFTRENCLKLFKDLPDLFADIREQSTKSALYRADIREIASKN